MRKLESARLKQWVEDLGFHASLPAAAFDEAGALVAANRRFLQLLRGPRASRKLPLSAEAFEALFPFQNEEESPIALLRRLLRASVKPHSEVAAAGLKNFSLHLSLFRHQRQGYVVLVAEMLRAGDLLRDRASRQTLFRSISHEVRTAVFALQGFVGMMKKDPSLNAGSASDILSGMTRTLRRLDNVVARMEDLKAELEVSDAVQSPERRAKPRLPGKKRAK